MRNVLSHIREIRRKRWVAKVYWASPPLCGSPTPVLPGQQRDLGSKRNQDGGFFLFHCGMGFTRLVLAGENTVLTSKGSLTYILTPGIILLVFPSNTFVSWWCGTRLREPRAHVVVSTKFHACSCLKPYFNRGLLRCYSIFKTSKWSCLFLGLSQRCIKHINIHKIHVQLKYKLIILRV